MKYIYLSLLLVLFTGCTPESKAQQSSNPEYRAYISTRLAEAILDFDNSVNEEVAEELCDGSGWITHGDGHKTECPGCDACEKKSQAPEVEWADESIQVNDILEELEIKADPKPEMIIDEETIKEILKEDDIKEEIEVIKEIDDTPEKLIVKKKGPVRKLFNR
jgi:hypothetical protein